MVRSSAVTVFIIVFSLSLVYYVRRKKNGLALNYVILPSSIFFSRDEAESTEIDLNCAASPRVSDTNAFGPSGYIILYFNILLMAQDGSFCTLAQPIHCSSVSVPINASGEDEEIQHQPGGDEPDLAEPAVKHFCYVHIDRSQKYPSSEKICNIPILACLIFLMVFITSTKWFIVNRKYKKEPASLFDPKRVVQRPTDTQLTQTIAYTFK